jgi:hypothetical protein
VPARFDAALGLRAGVVHARFAPPAVFQPLCGVCKTSMKADRPPFSRPHRRAMSGMRRAARLAHVRNMRTSAAIHCLYFLHTNEDQRRKFMSEHVYKQIELTGSSTKSIDDAISTAITKASKTLRNLHWFEVTETRGQIENDKVAYWQVTIKVGLRID